MMKVLLRSGAIVIALSAAAPVAAHDFWIQPARFRVEPAGATRVAIRVGHGPARQKWLVRLNRVTTLLSKGPDGRTVDHLDALQQGAYAPDPELSVASPGVHVVAFATTPAHNELPSDRFTRYLTDEGLTPALAQRARVRTTDQPGREVYSRRAKALVQVGSPGVKLQPQVLAPLGLTLEIVPEVNPYSPGRADALPVRILYKGRPLPGALVKITDLRADERPVETRRTDRAGRAVFHLPRQGEWQMNVIWTEPIQGDPEADWSTTFSSLTFGFPS